MKKLLGFTSACLLALPVVAQTLTGTVITVSGSADVKADNDQAVLNFYIEEQDKDKTAAASRVNQKMKSGTDLIRKEDPQAQLRTRSYYSYPIYAETPVNAVGQPVKRQIIGWRSGQYLEVKTTNIAQLSSTAAAGQKVLALNGVNFGLSDAAIKKFEAARVEAGYHQFSDKVKMIASTLGKKPDDIVIESLDFDNAGSELRQFEAAPMMLKAARADAAATEPSFEPGFTSLNIKITGKLRLK